ncbi:MAG: hypothetical protein H6707_08385 [Deltaproteobacteria bacterium]|nr:hypothetical protein [Deltaproteobacteria bacterium]
MADRNPNSVLVSLQELRKIEEERVSAEEEAERREAEAERQREEQARLTKLQAEEAARQAQENARLQAEREKEERQREEQIRLAEAERRARVEAEMHLEQHRIKAEAEAKALAKKVPWVPIGIVIGLLVIAVGTVGYFSYVKAQEQERTQKMLAQQKADLDRLRKEYLEKERQFQAEQDKLERESQQLKGALASATDETRRQAIREQIKSQRARAQALEERRRKAEKEKKRRAKRLTRLKTDDPIGGL